jgi:hypothetical protein
VAPRLPTALGTESEIGARGLTSSLASVDDEEVVYRALIDRLVTSSRDGQGQIAARWVREGAWRSEAFDESMPDKDAVNRMLGRLTTADRETVAKMLSEAFVSGIHETLVEIHAAGVKPLDHGYEGSPFNDFMGRLAGWRWPPLGTDRS